MKQRRGSSRWSTYQVFRADTRLQTKALRPGSPREAMTAATRKATQALEQLADQFPHWMQAEAEQLKAARDELARNGANRERLERLFVAAHDIRGQAATYDYPAAGDIAALLCTLIELAPDAANIPSVVVDQHVDAILAVVRQDIRGKGDPQTASLISALQILNEKTLQRMFRNTADMADRQSK